MKSNANKKIIEVFFKKHVPKLKSLERKQDHLNKMMKQQTYLRGRLERNAKAITQAEYDLTKMKSKVEPSYKAAQGIKNEFKFEEISSIVADIRREQKAGGICDARFEMGKELLRSFFEADQSNDSSSESSSSESSDSSSDEEGSSDKKDDE